ncbi:STAS domain-containing protein [Vibrio hepatarius]|uniref:STAS domain-containing protein n=1 Tax=Vibrio hepatarius TaxID=171383 RepID=UPI001C0967EB|nr:STAS domain-containing protein [Vibrio hepatarius]MBU2899279.1 STAS domain-containing protein [Vibrio hepatarius]
MNCLLPESLDISTVLDVTTLYQEWLTNQDSIELNAEKVVRVDAAGIQLLSCLFISAKKNHIEIQILKPTELLTDGIRTLGLSSVFERTMKVGE